MGHFFADETPRYNSKSSYVSSWKKFTGDYFQKKTRLLLWMHVKFTR